MRSDRKQVKRTEALPVGAARTPRTMQRNLYNLGLDMSAPLHQSLFLGGCSGMSKEEDLTWHSKRWCRLETVFGRLFRDLLKRKVRVDVKVLVDA